MMPGRKRDVSASLFERIEGENAVFSHSVQIERLQKSIKRNLRNILNARPGSCQSTLELGVIDLNDATATSADFRKTVENAIQECIEHFEPRVKKAVVQAVNNDGYNPMDLNFHIVAHVEFNGLRNVVEFNMQLDNHHHYLLD
ncbi:type VI secretion system baseplate subunit TssE [Enterobacteriaceae bacterium ML5]|jgi:type VI secretion system protein|nr:type VI secretion system baseplate subunit TssE [Enterobacteriaceae bacterium ML5]